MTSPDKENVRRGGAHRWKAVHHPGTGEFIGHRCEDCGDETHGSAGWPCPGPKIAAQTGSEQ